MPEHYRVSLASLERDGDEGTYPWETARNDSELSSAISLAIEGSRQCLVEPLEVLLAHVVQHIWEGEGFAHEGDEGWKGRQEALERFYAAALELLDKYGKSKP